MRAEMPEALLTIACGATPETWRHMDFARANKYLDHINIMGYDYNWPVLGSAHQSNIYPGRAGDGDHAQCGGRCVQYMLGLGLRADKLNMGVPFYAYVAGKGPDAFLRYDQVEILISSGECKYGLVRAIGISNFRPEHIRPLLESCEIIPMVNQISYYAGHIQRSVTGFCREHGIFVESYAPLATGAVSPIYSVPLFSAP